MAWRWRWGALRLRLRSLALAAALLASAARMSAGQPPGVGSCDPINSETACLFPFPNDFFSVADAGTPTGRRVRLPPDGVPRDRNGALFTTAPWDRLDGWSPATAIFAEFENVSLEASRVPGWGGIAASEREDCPTVLLDAATGERVAHFAELDMTTEARWRGEKAGQGEGRRRRYEQSGEGRRRERRGEGHERDTRRRREEKARAEGRDFFCFCFPNLFCL